MTTITDGEMFIDLPGASQSQITDWANRGEFDRAIRGVLRSLLAKVAEDGGGSWTGISERVARLRGNTESMHIIAGAVRELGGQVIDADIGEYVDGSPVVRTVLRQSFGVADVALKAARRSDVVARGGQVSDKDLASGAVFECLDDYLVRCEREAA